MYGDRPLERLTVFLLEDDMLIGLDIVMLLEDAGATVLGPYVRIDKAVEAIGAFDGNVPDCAVLDYQIQHETCETIAMTLNGLGVPIVLHTASAELMGDLASQVNAIVLSKPFGVTNMVENLLVALDRKKDDFKGLQS